MAALLLPLAFAGAGYLGFGTTGAAVGWLIGAWLFGPKATDENQIFDPGAQEMPRFNQSLRGVTIPVLFGTNRVASNVVWTHNFQTIRKETKDAQQGGGKGGGSGMGGKGGGGGSTQVSYEYKWDMLFHIGMGPETYGLFGGWMNTQRMSAETILAIISNNPGVPPINTSDPNNPSQTTGNNSNGTQSSNTAFLTFDDSFFGVGGPANDNSFDNWDWFEDQMGVPCRWPNTYYIGLKALSLGSQPAVPQLSWEIGPGDATITRDRDFLNSDDENGFDQGTNCIVIGEDGKHYHNITKSGLGEDNMQIWCLETDVMQTKHLADLPAGPSSTAANMQTLMAGGTPYILQLGWGFPGGSDIDVCATLWKINSSGDLERVQDYSFTQPSGQDCAVDLMHSLGFGLMSFDAIMSKNSGFLTWVMQYSLFDDHKIVLLSLKYRGSLAQENTEALYPIPNDGIGAPVSSPLDDLGFYMQVIDSDDLGNTPTGMRFNHQMRAFLVPEYHPENSPAPIVGNGKWPITYWIAFHVTKAMIAADDGSSDIVATYKGDYPNGFIVGWKLTGKVGEVEVGSATILNDRFKDLGGHVLDDFFEDSGKGLDENGDVNSEYIGPHLAVTPQGGVVLTWVKVFDKADDQGVENSYLKLKVFVWNPVSKGANLYTESEGPWWDAEEDFDVTPSGRSTPGSVAIGYDPANLNVYVVGNYMSSATQIGPATVASIWGPLNIGGGKDVYIAYIVWQILTNPIFGMGFIPDDVDDNAYQLALQYCADQDFKVSVQYTREEDVLGAIEDLLALMGGYLTYSGDKIRFGIQKFTASPVRTIDNDHLIAPKPGDPPVAVTKGAKQDGYNKVRVNYFDRGLDYRQNQYEIGDEVDQDFNGVRFKELPPKYVMARKMAAVVAERALWTNLYARDTYAFRLGWKDADLEPGDVITLVDSFHPELSVGKTVRITRWQEREKGKFDVQGVLEVPAYLTATRSVSLVNSNVPVGQNDPILPMIDFRMYELPREFQGANARFYVGYNQQSRIKGATLWLSPDGVSYSPAQNAEPYGVSGQFAQPLPAASPGDIETDVEIWVLPASGFSIATPTFCQTLALDDVSPGVRATGGGVMIVGSEAVSMENLTLLGQNHYRIGKLYRGWGGTQPSAVASGALWHRHAGGIITQEISQDQIGTTIYYKVVPYNFANQAYEVSSVEGKSYRVRGGYFVPQALQNLRTFVESGISGTSSDDLRGLSFKAVTSGGCDVTVDWPDTARVGGFGAGGFGAGTFGQYLADVDNHRWRVEVMSGGSVVRSTAVDSGPFTYTREQNSADFAGFAGAFQIRVTPFNNLGDAPISAVKSLNLFY